MSAALAPPSQCQPAPTAMPSNRREAIKTTGMVHVIDGDKAVREALGDFLRSMDYWLPVYRLEGLAGRCSKGKFSRRKALDLMRSVWRAFTIISKALEHSDLFRYILPVHATYRGCPETLILLRFSRPLGPWQRIPPSPPPFFSSEKVLQNQVFPEPPARSGVAPQCSTLLQLIKA
jgi:hypothetical protein